MTFVTQLKFKAEKKNSVRYNNTNNDAPITSLYIMKGALSKPYPTTITVEVKS